MEKPNTETHTTSAQIDPSYFQKGRTPSGLSKDFNKEEYTEYIVLNGPTIKKTINSEELPKKAKITLEISYT